MPNSRTIPRCLSSQRNEYKKTMTADQVREEFETRNKEQNDRVIEILKLNLDNDVQQKGDEARLNS